VVRRTGDWLRSSVAGYTAPITYERYRAVRMSDPAPHQPAARNGFRQLTLLILLAALVAALGYYTTRSTTTRDPAPGNKLALEAAGGWWSITGDRYLDLEWEGRRAVLWDYSSSETGVTSTGTWRTTRNTLIVQVSGPAGQLREEFELLGNDVEAFLAPAPASTAKLIDCWIADHGDDDEDSAPPGPTPQETLWYPRSDPIPRFASVVIDATGRRSRGVLNPRQDGLQ
jgi:hypothetical protein